MNFDALKFVRELRGADGAAKAVLYSLATRADENGVCWPALATISDDSGVSKSTVCAKLLELEKGGILHRTPGSRKVNTHYRLQFSSSDQSESRTDAPLGSVREPDRSDADLSGSRTLLSESRTDICPGAGHQEHIQETNKNTHVPDSNLAEVGKVISTWESLGLPKIRHLSEKRRKAINTRLKDFFFRDNYVAGMTNIAASDFHTGRMPGKNWRADLDWFLKPDSVVKAMELTAAPAGTSVAANAGALPLTVAGARDWLPFPGWELAWQTAFPDRERPHVWKNLSREEQKTVHATATKKLA